MYRDSCHLCLSSVVSYLSNDEVSVNIQCDSVSEPHCTDWKLNVEYVVLVNTLKTLFCNSCNLRACVTSGRGWLSENPK